MAINVILCHFVVVYYPQMYFGDFAEQLGGTLSLFSHTSLSALVNGNIAVQYFFVLTGFLVGRSFLRRDTQIDNEYLLKKCGQRYSRLLPVVAVATVITFFLMKMKLMYHLDIVEYAANGAFLEGYCSFEPTVANLLLNVFYRPFVNGSAYIGPFWMLHYEVWGYILCMLLCSVAGRSRFRRMIYVGTALLTKVYLDANYVPFFMGVFVADLYYCEDRNTTYLSLLYQPIVAKKWFVWCCLWGGLLFASCPMYIKPGSFWRYLTKYPGAGMVRGAGVAIAVYGLLRCERLAKVFEWKPFLWLGKRSYVIYALHWPIMLSLQAYLFKQFQIRMRYDAAALLAFGIVVPVIFLVSHGVHWLLEEKGPKIIQAIKTRLSVPQMM